MMIGGRFLANTLSWATNMRRRWSMRRRQGSDGWPGKSDGDKWEFPGGDQGSKGSRSWTWATWCGPCRMSHRSSATPDEYEGKVTVAKLDVDANQQTAIRLSRSSILFFRTASTWTPSWVPSQPRAEIGSTSASRATPESRPAPERASTDRQPERLLVRSIFPGGRGAVSRRAADSLGHRHRVSSVAFAGLPSLKGVSRRDHGDAQRTRRIPVGERNQ